MATKNPVAKTKATKEQSTSLVDYKAELSKLAGETKAVEEGLQQSSSISFKSGQMSFMGAPIKGNTMPVNVLDSALENAYYDGPYDPDNLRSPICFAFGTGAKGEVMAPHADSETPQSPTCKACKWNVFGTADQGKGKACKNMRRVALIHADAVDKGATEIAGTTIATAKLSPMNAPIYSKYALGLASAKSVPPIGVITQMSCEPDAKSQFKVSWHFVRDVTDNAAMGALMARREEAKATLFRPYPKNAEVVAKAAPAKKAGAKRKY